MKLSPEEAHAMSRMLEDYPPNFDALRRYVPLYRSAANGVHLGSIAYGSQVAAWTKPRGPYVPEDLEIIDVIEVRATLPNGDGGAA